MRAGEAPGSQRQRYALRGTLEPTAIALAPPVGRGGIYYTAFAGRALASRSKIPLAWMSAIAVMGYSSVRTSYSRNAGERGTRCIVATLCSARNLGSNGHSPCPASGARRDLLYRIRGSSFSQPVESDEGLE